MGHVLIFRQPDAPDGFYVVSVNAAGEYFRESGPFESRSEARRAGVRALWTGRQTGRWFIGEATAGVLTVAQPR